MSGHPEPPLRIALSARLMHDPPAELGFRHKVLQYLEQSAAHWVMSHGALAFMVPTLYHGSELKRREISMRDYADAMDGLILQGGADVAPVSYGETPMQDDWAGDVTRDRYEIELLWAFIIRGKPVLGICRGCQLINVALGGSLLQDITSLVPHSLMHRDAELYDAHRHSVRFVAGSRLAALYPEVDTALISSIHHQCVARLGNDLVAEAHSEDGLVEAIRWRGSSYLTGFQWHPEFHAGDPNLLDSGPLLQEFLAAAEALRSAG